MNARTSVLLLAGLLPFHPSAAAGSHYRCTDDRGHAYVLPGRIDLSLTHFDCVFVADGGGAAAAAPEEAPSYTAIVLTVPRTPVPAMPFESLQRTRPVLRKGVDTAKVDQLIASTARRFGHDPYLLRAIVQVESAFNVGAVSPKGAIGLMQLMPATAQRYGVDIQSELFNPAINLHAGARYLADLWRLFPRQVELVLAAYNAGEGAVIRRNYSVPPFPETQAYVRAVLQAYDSYRQAGR